MKNLTKFLFLFIPMVALSQVGIGTASPSEDLDIDGSIRVRDLNEGYITSSSTGVLGISPETKTVSGHNSWSNVLVGSKAAKLDFVGRVSVGQIEVTFSVFYRVSGKSFAIINNVGCTVTNLGATDGNDGRLEVDVLGIKYVLTFVSSAGGTMTVTSGRDWIQGAFFSIINAS